VWNSQVEERDPIHRHSRARLLFAAEHETGNMMRQSGLETAARRTQRQSLGLREIEPRPIAAGRKRQILQWIGPVRVNLAFGDAIQDGIL
jgi:hypothetical protein